MIIAKCCRISVCGSIYMIMSVGIERYLAVCRPHHYHQVQAQSYRALVYIIPALTAAVLINITKFMEFEERLTILEENGDCIVCCSDCPLVQCSTGCVRMCGNYQEGNIVWF